MLYGHQERSPSELVYLAAGRFWFVHPCRCCFYQDGRFWQSADHLKALF